MRVEYGRGVVESMLSILGRAGKEGKSREYVTDMERSFFMSALGETM